MHHFLNVDSITVSYDKKPIAQDVSFTLKEGELGCLLGPSGCGKTTILKAISGFTPLDAGNITLDDQLLSSTDTHLSPETRNVGMVFQDHALFPHLTIAENIGFGLHKRNQMERKSIIHTMLELIGLHGHEHKYPHELSGGQSQRVAVARAIAPQPKLLLMDEPFSNLDTDLREKLGREIRSLLKKQGITAIMVTHDQHDAFALGDKIGVIANGALQQWGTSYKLYHQPSSRFVANFIGNGSFVNGTMTQTNTVITNFGEIRGESNNNDLIGSKVDILIRPDDVVFDPNSLIHGEIQQKIFKGAQTLYTIRLQTGDILESMLPSHLDYEIGDTIGVSIQADHLVCFAA